MPEGGLRILFDQNVPMAVAGWLREKRPSWLVEHVNEVDLKGQPDPVVYPWGQERRVIVDTFDEDFADARYYPLGHHHGVIRLRVWPTTTERTIEALTQLLEALPEERWPGSLVIIDNTKLRIRNGVSASST